uniref:Protein ZIP4 homolog n=1 Tax=Magallana gigas TaxID=29159 RepID=K1R9X1_MAGGI
MDCYLVAYDLKSLIRDICGRESQEDGSWCDLVEKAFRLSDKVMTEIQQNPNKGIMEQLETVAVNLWNFTVSLKTGRRLSLLSNAKLRHICLKIVEATVITTEDTMKIKRKIAMGLKTARAWLDTKDIPMAIKVLDLTDQFIKQLQKLVIEDINKLGASDSLEKEKLDVEQDLFKLLCYKAEAGAFLSMLCYNFGVELYQKKKLEEAVSWLKESFEMGKHQTNLDARNQARTLRLLASVYLEMDQEDLLQKALNAVTLANNVYPHPSGLFLYLRILLKAKEPNSVINKAILDIMQQPGISPDVGINTALILSKNERHDLAVGLMKELLKKFEHSANIGDLLMSNFDILLAARDRQSLKEFVEFCIVAILDIMQQPGISPDVGINTALLLSKNERHDLAVGLMKELLKKFEHSANVGDLLMSNFDILLAARDRQSLKEFVEFCIVENNTHRALEPAVKSRFHIEFWALAYTADEEKNYQEALDWYNYSLSLYSREESGDQNLARLHRNRATCYLNLGQMDKATESVNEAKKLDPSSINILFMLFKLALAGSNIEQAKDVLQNMCSEVAKLENTDKESEAQKLICQAAFMAYESNKESTASLALECLANCSSDLYQTLTALRCLIRLKLSHVDQDKSLSLEDIGILRDIRMAYNKLLQAQDIGGKMSQKQSEEASWFMRVAWNLALKCEKKPDLMKDLFILCSQYSGLCPDDEENTLMRKKTCLLMAAAACLQQARTEGMIGVIKQNFLEETIHLIHECKVINQQIKQEMDMDSSLDSRSRDKADILMLMYEFEARCKLQDPTVEEVIEVLLKIPNPDPKPFETIAALSLEPPSHHKNVAVRALKIAIRKHQQQPTVDYQRISALFHSLIQMALNSVSDNTKQEALGYYGEVVDLIDKKAQMTNTYADILDQMDKRKIKKSKKGLEE